MKKTALIFFIIMLSFPVSKVFAQDISYEIEVSYHNNQVPLTADIMVKVMTGIPGFTYYLMTNDPIHGTILQQSELTKKKNYVFRDVKPGKYFLKIQDNTGTQAGKTVNVLENQM